MPIEPFMNIQVVPQSANPSFDQREQGIAHTSYLEETMFFSMVQQGNVEGVQAHLGRFFESGIVVGRLSDDPVRQVKYWAVCCITIGTRYAIQGGLDEMTVFNLADAYILKVDKMSQTEQIGKLLQESVLELTSLVRKNACGSSPAPVRRALNYINTHLHSTFKVADVARAAGLSEDHLAKLFKKHIGKTVVSYVRAKRLDSAKAMLQGGCNEKMLGYYLGFSSQSYFITCFKKAFGITPHQYAQNPFAIR